MNKCYMQLWEQSSLAGNISCGCSIHYDLSSHSEFISNLYSLRKDISVEEKYDRVVSPPFECFISDELYQNLIVEKSIRLSEVEKSNLAKFQDLIIKL